MYCKIQKYIMLHTSTTQTCGINSAKINKQVKKTDCYVKYFIHVYVLIYNNSIVGFIKSKNI